MFSFFYELGKAGVSMDYYREGKVYSSCSTLVHKLNGIYFVLSLYNTLRELTGTFFQPLLAAEGHFIFTLVERSFNLDWMLEKYLLLTSLG